MKKINKTFLVKNNKSKLFIFLVALGKELIEQKLSIGISAINEEAFNQISKQDRFKELIENGDIQLMASKIDEAETDKEKEAEAEKMLQNIAEGATEDLKEFNAKDSVRLVKETLDLKVLKKWVETEERTTVIKAIEAQIKKLTTDEEENK